MREMVAVLDFGSQYAQLIARRIRELGVYCEILIHDATADEEVLSVVESDVANFRQLLGMGQLLPEAIGVLFRVPDTREHPVV